MLEKIYIDEPGHSDLNMYRCGIEDCSSGYAWGPGVRDHYIIHYILNGKGTFHMDGTAYELGQNDGFLICPKKVVYYRSDSDNPWSYAWVGFHGLKAEGYLKQAGLDSCHPVFRYDRDTFLKDCLTRMIETKAFTRSRDLRLLGLLHEFLAQLIETACSANIPDKNVNRREEYVKKAVEFIRMNYSRKISISEIARNSGLDRSYLYSLFNEFLNTSPQQFLIYFRISKACELMQDKKLTIGDISRSVGYEDPLIFSKIFRKVKGMPPREYRKSL